MALYESTYTKLRAICSAPHVWWTYRWMKLTNGFHIVNNRRSCSRWTSCSWWWGESASLRIFSRKSKGFHRCQLYDIIQYVLASSLLCMCSEFWNYMPSVCGSCKREWTRWVSFVASRRQRRSWWGWRCRLWRCRIRCRWQEWGAWEERRVWNGKRVFTINLQY